MINRQQSICQLIELTKQFTVVTQMSAFLLFRNRNSISRLLNH